MALLGRPGPSTNILYHALSDEFSFDPLILERSPSATAMLRRRARRVGWWTVVGQALFLLIARPILERAKRLRVEQILSDAGLSAGPINAPALQVRSANDAAVAAALRERQPIAVLVSGTRILSSALLSSADRPFINVHAGITPRYRGVHGGYWALARGEPDACGVSVHLVDPGVDTGPVLGQAVIRPSAEDNFVTYPYLQLATAIPFVRAALRQAAQGRIVPLEPPPGGPSRAWSHPTLWGYWWTRLVRGVR